MNETAKKILGYINRLPETYEGNPIRQWALENFDENIDRYEAMCNELLFINESFVWADTPQRDDYWYSIHKKIRSGELQLLPEVTEAQDDISDTSTWSFETKAEFADFLLKEAYPSDNALQAINKFKAYKQRIPLFTTEDGVQVFDGDEYWEVYSDLSMFKLKATKCENRIDEIKNFSTEAAAKEYVRVNKPSYSIAEIKAAWRADKVVSLKDFIIEIEKLKPWQKKTKRRNL